jgi:DNA primase
MHSRYAVPDLHGQGIFAGRSRHMSRVVPERFSAMLGPKNRIGTIFID